MKVRRSIHIEIGKVKFETSNTNNIIQLSTEVFYKNGVAVQFCHMAHFAIKKAFTNTHILAALILGRLSLHTCS